MATANISVSANFIQTNATQPDYSTPSTLPVYPDAIATQTVAYEVTLAAAGTSYTLQVPTMWTRATQVFIQNTDLTGYCVLTLNATSGAPVTQLAPLGGLFAWSHAGSIPAGTVAPTPGTWTLKSCDSAGVLANGVATKVYIYMAGY